MRDEDLLQSANAADHAACEAGRDRPILYGPYHLPALRAVAQAAREEEREACAVECVNVAEHYRKKCWDEAWEGAMDCADTIRSREPDAQDERDGGGCDTFERGAPSGDCEGDGHYECRECRSRAAAGGGKEGAR